MHDVFNKKLPRLALLAVSITLMIVMFTLVFYINDNYYEVYDFPKPLNAVVDFEGYTDLENRATHANLSGEWEFFYNRWIITDKEENPAPDGMLNLPGYWTGKEFNGQKLPKTGYASFRMRVINLKKYTEVRAYATNANAAYKIFINGFLVVENGTVSKDLGVAKAGVDEPPYKTAPINESGNYTIVVEVSNNDGGGFITPVSLAVTSSRQPLHWFTFQVYYLPCVILGLMMAFFLFSILISSPANGTKKRAGHWAFSALILTAIINLFISRDMYFLTVDVIGLSITALPIAAFIMSFFLSGASIFNIVVNKIIRFNKFEAIGLIAVNLAAFIAFFPLAGTQFQLISRIVPMATLLFVSVKIAVSKVRFRDFFVYFLINTCLIFALIGDFFDSNAVIIYDVGQLFAIELFFMVVPLLLLNFFDKRDKDKKLLAAAQFENEITKIQKQALMAQINPHFTFNVLSSIQDAYHENPDTGEKMLVKFSKHLRTNVDSYKKELTSFKEELENILNYLDLENLRYNGKLNLILNTAYEDFELPPLSLQPFLENAIKYACTHEMPDGNLEIYSALNRDQSVTVKVLDNGKGFDTSKIREGAVGIKNATDRLKYGLGATVAVESKIGEGTAVTINIPGAKA